MVLTWGGRLWSLGHEGGGGLEEGPETLRFVQQQRFLSCCCCYRCRVLVVLQVHLQDSAVHCRMRQMPALEVLVVLMKVSCQDGEEGPFWAAGEEETEG